MDIVHFFNVVRMKRMVRTGDFLDAVVNNQSIILFEQTTVIMELNPHIEVTF